MALVTEVSPTAVIRVPARQGNLPGGQNPKLDRQKRRGLAKVVAMARSDQDPSPASQKLVRLLNGSARGQSIRSGAGCSVLTGELE